MAGNLSAASEPHGPPPALKPSGDSQSAETGLCVSPAPSKLPLLHPTLGGANLAQGPAFSFPCVPRPGTVGQSSWFSFASVHCLLLSRLGVPFPRVANTSCHLLEPVPTPTSLPTSQSREKLPVGTLPTSSFFCLQLFHISFSSPHSCTFATGALNSAVMTCPSHNTDLLLTSDLLGR